MASEDRRTRAPAGLGQRGRAFWQDTLREFELSDVELQLLRECCRMLDECDLMHETVKAEGVTVEGSAGQPRAHPALSELRQARLTLGKLLAQLELPDPDGSTLPSPASAKGAKAARARWRAHNEDKARWAHG